MQAYVKGDGNHNDTSATASATITINRAQGSVKASISGTTTVGQTLTASYQTASDGNVTYQWWRGSTSTSISGATKSTYKLEPADASQYIGVTVKVAQGTNYTECSTTAKTTATIKDITPAFTTHPASVAVKEGNTAKFTVVGSGSNLTYQWQQSTNSGSTWTNIQNATTASYTTPATTEIMNGYQYRCVITNNAGSVNSNAATLTVYYPPKVATHPSNATVTYPATATFKVTATAGNPSTTTYQWQVSKDNGSTWSNITNATSASYTTPATIVAMTGYKYRCLLGNAQYPSNSATGTAVSNAAILTVEPAIITIPGSPAEKTYDGSAQAHGVTIPENTSIVTGESTVEATNAGTYNIVIYCRKFRRYVAESVLQKSRRTNRITS